MNDSVKTWRRVGSWPRGLLQHRGGFFYVRLASAGKTRFVPLETTTLEVAKIRCAEKTAFNERTRRALRGAKRGVMTMGDLLTIQRERIAEQEGIVENTRQLKLQTCDFLVKTWPGFAAIRPDAIRPSVVEEWRNRALREGTGYRPPGAKKVSPKMAGRSASTFNKAVDMLRHLLNLAVDRGAIPGNPLAGRRGLKAKDRPHKPKLPETPTMLRLFDEVQRVGGKGVPAAELLRLLAFTGCRLREAGALRWCDVDFARGLVTVRGTKTAAAAREVPMIPAARDLLEKIRARRIDRLGEDAIAPETPILIVREAQKGLNRACEALGVERLTHHDLRDFFATTCIEAGVDVPTVAAWLGHADGGALLMRVYQHHRRPHSLAQAARVQIGGAA